MKRAWLVRAGRLGEQEALTLKQNLAVVGWLQLPDLSRQDTRESLMLLLQQTYPEASSKRLVNWRAQIWAFRHTISNGDLVVLPLKTTSAVAIGEVVAGYQYRPDLPADARHTRPVKWLKPDLPRTAFGRDLLYSLGTFLTVCEIRRHDAVRRLENLARTGQDPGWPPRYQRRSARPSSVVPCTPHPTGAPESLLQVLSPRSETQRDRLDDT